jgi:hypothetical protein
MFRSKEQRTPRRLAHTGHTVQRHLLERTVAQTPVRKIVRVIDAVHLTVLAQGRTADFRHSRVAASIGSGTLPCISTALNFCVSSLVPPSDLFVVEITVVDCSHSPFSFARRAERSGTQKNDSFSNALWMTMRQTCVESNDWVFLSLP